MQPFAKAHIVVSVQTPELYLASTVSEAETALVRMLALRQPGFQATPEVPTPDLLAALESVMHRKSDEAFEFNHGISLGNPNSVSLPQCRDRRFRGISVDIGIRGIGTVMLRSIRHDVGRKIAFAEGDFEGPALYGRLMSGVHTIYSEGVVFKDGRTPLGISWYDFGLEDDTPGQSPRTWARYSYNSGHYPLTP